MMKETHNSFKIILALCFVIPILSIANEAIFAAANSNDVIGSTLCTIVNNLKGGIAKSIGTMAIFAVGVGLFMGKLNWGTAFVTAAGVAVVFGADKLLWWLAGSTVTNATCASIG
jgi:type IV secretory pathway VirB2 component (pilin)